jgi:CheY-like chemotaxis protein
MLVVDDDPVIRDLVAEVLVDEGYAVETAANGAEAIALLDHMHPALILLDMRMPVLDGWGVMAHLRATRVQTPVIIMTAAQDARRWATEVGAHAWLAKPFDVDDLLTLVAETGAPDCDADG